MGGGDLRGKNTLIHQRDIFACAEFRDNNSPQGPSEESFNFHTGWS